MKILADSLAKIRITTFKNLTFKIQIFIMKYKLSLIIALFIISLSSAQIKVSTVEKPQEIGKVGAGLGVWFATLEKFSDGNYTLSYKDFKYQQIEEWKSFEIGAEDVDVLYNLLIENFEKMPSEDIKVELPEDILIINYKKSFGVSVVTIYHSVNKNPEVMGVTQSFTKKQITKLFGKRK